ncbi:BBE domain-containing protein [Streptomyces vinaceus]|uniref:BBE domain-containing protein n=1 Tax=Streptomyces vinaceus TaxID=1960 RepID=UPI00368A9365
MHRTLRRHLRTDAAYVNFPDPDLRDWQRAYYGANYDRLVEGKRRYDPAGLFPLPASTRRTRQRRRERVERPGSGWSRHRRVSSRSRLARRIAVRGGRLGWDRMGGGGSIRLAVSG